MYAFRNSISELLSGLHVCHDSWMLDLIRDMCGCLPHFLQILDRLLQPGKLPWHAHFMLIRRLQQSSRSSPRVHIHPLAWGVHKNS